MNQYDPYDVVRQFENALAGYTGAPYVVTTNSCTSALLLAVAWHLRHIGWVLVGDPRLIVEIPKRTYVSVPQSIIHAGGRPTFRDEDWVGAYQLKPLPVWDAARRFTTDMYRACNVCTPGAIECVSFHASKILGDTQGGAILHNNPEADAWLRRARFDGRTEGVEPKADTFNQIGWHCMMTPDVAARLLVKLSVLPAHNEDLANSDYPDLSLLEIFK